MPEKKILIIDDHVELLQWLEQAFSKTGYQVYTATSGEAGLHLFFDHRPDAVILDIILPGIDGWETCDRIRQFSDVPIIMITGMGSEEDNIASLNDGADDYMLKPFRVDILLAKVEALLRRTVLPVSLDTSQNYADDHLVIDLAARDVFVRGEPVPLSPKEYQLLAYLVQRAGQVISHNLILQELWGWEAAAYTRNVHLYIGRLRRKIEVNPRQPRYIVTVPRMGYRFRKRPSS